MSYTSRPSAATVVAELMRKRGIELDPLRLQERVAVERERRNLEDKQHITDVRAAASAAVRARRAYSLAMGFWRQKPTADNLAAAERAKADQKAAEQQLRELCSHDEELIAAALSKARL